MKHRRQLEKGAESLLMMSAGVSVVSVLFITLFIVIEGVPLFFRSQTGHPPPTVFEFLLGAEWFPTDDPPKYGILPFIVGSLLVTAGALAMAVPIGVSVGIYVAEIAGPRAGRIMRRVSELLAAIPSVIYGFVGLMMIGFFLQRFKDPIVNYNAFSAMLVLAVMTLPTIINITEVSIRSVPTEFKNGALAIGSTHWQTIWRVLLPSARGGVITGIILGMGRAVGETMAVLMVAGNQPTLPMDGLRSRVRTLTMAVVNDMGYAAGDHRVALFATAIVLFLFVLSLNLATQIIAHRSRIKVQ